MVLLKTKMEVADNSGAREVECIKVLGGTHRKEAAVGDVIVVAVKKAIPSSKIVKKGDVCRAVVVRTKKPYFRSDGTSIKFDRNAVVLLNKQSEMLGSGVFGPIPRELRDNFMKIISLAPEVL